MKFKKQENYNNQHKKINKNKQNINWKKIYLKYIFVEKIGVCLKDVLEHKNQ